MVYENCKIYGPYTRKDGRKHVCIILPDKSRTTVSYPKYLIEKHLNRYLEKDETVDHEDRDFTNNSISNLQILTRKEHGQKDARRIRSQTFTCPMCDKIFILEGKRLNDSIQNRKKGNRGPYCGRSCAGSGLVTDPSISHTKKYYQK